VVDRPAPQTDHSGGIIRNNFIWRAAGTPPGVDTPDCGILVWDSPGTRVLHNTVFQNGSYPNTIEYRFHTTGAEIRFNLCDGAIADRGGGTSGNAVSGNVTNAQGAWFVNAGAADLRLGAGAPLTVVDAAATHADVSNDFDGNLRPAGSGPDIGAHEFGGSPPAPMPPVAPQSCSAVSLGGLSIRVSWIDGSSDEDGFRVERSEIAGPFATATTLGPGATSYTDNGLTAGKAYTYRVFSFNAAGDSAPSNTATATATSSTPTGAPIGASGSACTAGQGLFPLVLLMAALRARPGRRA
jgi:hypothetical protein